MGVGVGVGACMNVAFFCLLPRTIEACADETARPVYRSASGLAHIVKASRKLSIIAVGWTLYPILSWLLPWHTRGSLAVQGVLRVVTEVSECEE